MPITRPSFLPDLALGGLLETWDEDQRERDKELCDFYNGIKEKLECIPYGQVSDRISVTVAEKLTHPTPTLQDDRWQDVMAKMGSQDLTLQGKLKWNKEWNEPFYAFLKTVFARDERNKLWTLIKALWIEKCTDVLDAVQKDIEEFLSSYSFDMALQSATVPVQGSLDSGFEETSLSSFGSNSRQGSSMNNHTIDGGQSFLTHEIFVQERSLKQDNCLLAPPINTFLLNQNLEETVTKKVPTKEIIFSKDHVDPIDPFLSFSSKTPDLSFLDGDNGHSKKSGVIRVFIPHTQNNEDEQIAEDVARRLREVEEYEFDPYLLKDAFTYLDLDAPEFVMRIIETMDFLVPVLTKAYLEEIQAKGNPNDYSSYRLILRYFHSVSQGRIINKNSLNYLIRPIMSDDVTFGMVRRWHEFNCALKYPKDFRRLVKNLHDTKQFLEMRNFCK